MPSEPDLVEVTELTFPVGLPGFADLRRFALSRWGGEDSPYARLVSLDEPDTAFLVAPPEAFFDDYEVVLPDEDAQLLQLDDADDALVLVMITLGEQVEEATANLLGPLVLNTRAQVGMQVVLNDSERSTRVPLRQD
jgi:flagellar assembly factor FliW